MGFSETGSYHYFTERATGICRTMLVDPVETHMMLPGITRVLLLRGILFFDTPHTSRTARSKCRACSGRHIARRKKHLCICMFSCRVHFHVQVFRTVVDCVFYQCALASCCLHAARLLWLCQMQPMRPSPVPYRGLKPPILHRHSMSSRLVNTGSLHVV